MKTEIEVPEGVNVSLSGKAFEVTGPLGTVKRDLAFMPLVSFSIKDDKVLIETGRERKRDKMFLNTARAHITNLIKGVVKGYKYKLDMVYVHFPMRLSVKGNDMVLDNFLGSKTQRKIWKHPDVEVKIQGKKISVEGLNKEYVGQTAANIEGLAKVKSKDRRIFKDGIFLSERGNIHE